MSSSLSGTSAVVIFLACTAAILAYTYVFAFGNRKPVRRRIVSGRPAAPYWHHPTGMQDERGIRPVDRS